jgi:hypothetical protein
MCFAHSTKKECTTFFFFFFFFFMEMTITGIVYLDMLQQSLIPLLDEDDQEGRIHFQQDGAPLHYSGEVREYPVSEVGGLVERRR